MRRQVERGVFDIEVIKEANKALIDTIEESLQIAEEGRRQRADSERQLQACETELRDVLSATKSKSPLPPS